MSEYSISILIASLHSRRPMLHRLLWHLKRQITVGAPVQILVAIDNGEKTTGAKRQQLLTMAKGKYVISIDDDDWVPSYYVAELLKATCTDADCFAINGIMTTNGQHPVRWQISKQYANEDKIINNQTVLFRRTNHITAVKREIALKAGFPDKTQAEDKYYSDRVAPLCQTEHTIDLPMYEYLYVKK